MNAFVILFATPRYNYEVIVEDKSKAGNYRGSVTIVVHSKILEYTVECTLSQITLADISTVYRIVLIT